MQQISSPNSLYSSDRHARLRTALAVLLLLSVAVYRPFCRYLCPLGAVYGLFNPIAFYRFTVEQDACTHCGKCQKSCPMDLPVRDAPNSPECIRCGKCIHACPHDALHSTLRRKNAAEAAAE